MHIQKHKIASGCTDNNNKTWAAFHTHPRDPWRQLSKLCRRDWFTSLHLLHLTFKTKINARLTGLEALPASEAGIPSSRRPGRVIQQEEI